MEPNLQPGTPSVQPTREPMPDSKEPDTVNNSVTQPIEPVVSATDHTALDSEQATTAASNPVTTPLPSSASVVPSTTPSVSSSGQTNAVPAKKKTRMILIVILVVAILAATGMIIYVSTLR